MKKMVKKTMAGILTLSLAVSLSGSCLFAETEKKQDDKSIAYNESGVIWIAGDSIASKHDKDEANEVQITGWGDVLQQIAGKNVTIKNKARSGRSSKSFTQEKDYKEIMREISAGDYLIIQFGHNDENEKQNLFTDPEGDSNTEGSYKYYLKKKYIEPAYEKDARVILATSVVRHFFENDKLAKQTHAVYAEAMRELVEECRQEGMDVFLLDTHKITEELYNRIGDEGTVKLHAVLGKGADSKLDTTHYSPFGAVYIASMIGQELKELGLECVQDVQKAWLIEDNSETIENTRTQLDKFNWR